MFGTLLSQIFPRGNMNLGVEPRLKMHFGSASQPDPGMVKLIEQTQKLALNYDTVVDQGLSGLSDLTISDLTISAPASTPQTQAAKKVAKKIIVKITQPVASPTVAPTIPVSPVDTASKIAEKAALEGLVPSPTTTTSVLSTSPESVPAVTKIANNVQAIGTKTLNTTLATPAGLIPPIQPVAIPGELGISLAPTSAQGAADAIGAVWNTTAAPIANIATATPVSATPALPAPSFSLLQFGNLANTVKKAAKGFLPLIPQVLYELYRSEIRVLQNINVNIVATSTPKTYKIGFGNENGEEMNIEFSVIAGKFYRQETPVVKDDFKPIFRATNLLSYIPILNRFEWKRQIRHTDCNIYIDDPGNLSLKDGPISVYYPLSEDEGFNFIYRDPMTIHPSSDNEKMFDNIQQAESSSDYRHFYSATVKIREPLYSSERTETFQLPFHEDRNNPEHFYLSVTQSRL